MKLFAAVVLLASCACQLSAGSEDFDWGEEQTAVWAIARENDIVLELHAEAAAKVQKAAEGAKQRVDELVGEHLAAWQAPIDEAVARGNASGVDVNKCSFWFDLSYPIGNVKAAVPLCLVAARAQWDAEVAALRAVADDMLTLLVQARRQSKACDQRPGAMLQSLCRNTDVRRTVLAAQDNKSRKAVTPYWRIVRSAPPAVASDAEACMRGAFGRSDLGANNSANGAVRCINELIDKSRQQ